MELYKGRPEDTSGRLEREIRTYDFLDKLGMTYWRTDHADQPAGSMEACNDIDAVLGVLICKNLFLCNRQETAFYLLLMPGDKKIQDKITLINAIPIFFHNCATLIVEIISHPLATEYTSVIPIDFLSKLSNLFLLNHIILLRRLQPYLP